MEPAELIAANADMIDRLRTHSAMRPDAFQQRFLGPIEALAREVGALPATATGLFSGELGLFRAALECAFFSFQASDGRIFTGSAGVEKRHALEHRWRYLCFAAGLIYPVGKSLERIVVTEQGGKPWSRHHSSLTDWATTNAVTRLYVSWPDTDDSLGPSNTGLLLLPRVLGPENLQHLQDGSGDLVACLYQMVAGGTPAAPIAHQVVTGAWERIIRREAARRPQAFGRVVAGTHLGPYLIGAIRAQLADGRWKVNESPLRADKDGAYLLWPDAAPDLIAYGKSNGYAGWPSEDSTLAELLVAAGIAERRTNDLGYVELVGDGGEILKALRFANPLAVLENYDPDDYVSAQTLKGVLAADPLAGVEEQEASEPTKPAAAPASAASGDPVAAARPAPVAEAVPAAESAVAPPPAATPGQAASSRAPAPAAGQAKAPAAGGKLVEGPEVRYSDLVPPEMRKLVGDQLHVEWLGKLVKLWRERKPDAKMRRTDHGVAIAFALLNEHLRDPAKWCESMSKAGLLYTPPQTPGAKVHEVAFPEGGKKHPAVTIAELACKKLGL